MAAGYGRPVTRTQYSRRGRFYRPELETGWQRLGRSWVFRITAGAVVLLGAAALVVAAVLRFS